MCDVCSCLLEEQWFWSEIFDEDKAGRSKYLIKIFDQHIWRRQSKAEGRWAVRRDVWLLKGGTFSYFWKIETWQGFASELRQGGHWLCVRNIGLSLKRLWWYVGFFYSWKTLVSRKNARGSGGAGFCDRIYFNFKRWSSSGFDAIVSDIFSSSSKDVAQVGLNVVRFPNPLALGSGFHEQVRRGACLEASKLF